MSNTKAVDIMKKHILLKVILDKHKDGWQTKLGAEITFSSVGDKDSKAFYPIYMHWL